VSLNDVSLCLFLEPPVLPVIGPHLKAFIERDGVCSKDWTQHMDMMNTPEPLDVVSWRFRSEVITSGLLALDSEVLEPGHQFELIFGPAETADLCD